MSDDVPEISGYGRVRVLVSALVGLAVAFLLVWWASGFAIFYEVLFRVDPIAPNAPPGVGADWVAGNTVAWLDFLIAITHAADVLMGLFILVMVFVHWAAFRRLAGRMRQPGEGAEAVVADGGRDGSGGDRE